MSMAASWQAETNTWSRTDSLDKEAQPHWRASSWSNETSAPTPRPFPAVLVPFEFAIPGTHRDFMEAAPKVLKTANRLWQHK